MADTIREKIKAVLVSRRFWVAVAGVTAVLLKDRLPFSDDQIQQVILILGSWIVGESLRSSEGAKSA